MTVYSEDPGQHSPTSNYSYNYVFEFEENFDPVRAQRWMIRNWSFSFYLSALYLVLVFGGQKWIASRKPVRVRYFFFVWNTFLAVFSTVAFLRLAPDFYYSAVAMGFHFSVCDNSTFYSDKTAAVWYWLFVLSKAPELFDTIFIVLRHQRLIFLHWFHHMATLVFTWFLYSEFAAISRWFATLNLLTHAIMYGYFALRTLRFRPPRIVAMSITTTQVVQMVFGTIVSAYAFAMHLRGTRCAVSRYSGLSAVVLYATYLGLFSRLFIKSYLTVKPEVKSKTK